eukprot:CAMPEP_0113577588 /NCGR_PEP_ID=MMETSP0015_2-20120614/28967_1 /TAXON_ID=2838 /ORGANISM="Odontella" /LENGTH=92 /DNA_ID=CAMNT_0000481215 /DNA_START=111 /DNA_END=389 /DNA_ORIENTATION=- /assembly_acc=CAM_ASM_000160
MSGYQEGASSGGVTEEERRRRDQRQRHRGGYAGPTQETQREGQGTKGNESRQGPHCSVKRRDQRIQRRADGSGCTSEERRYILIPTSHPRTK